MKNQFTFDDLKFGPHPNGVPNSVQAKLTLPNNIVVSVVGGGSLYGDGVELFEMAAWEDDSKKFIQLGEFDDVIGWRTKEEITEQIQKLANS